MPIVHLVGTSHQLQGVAPLRNASGEARFCDYIGNLASQLKVDIVGEEASIEVANLFCGSALSPIATLMQRLGIPHVYLDPTDQEGVRLGIPHSVASKLARLEGRSDEAERIESVRWEGREAEWQRRLQTWDFERALVICGSSHIPTLRKRLTDAGYEIVIEDPNWTP